MEVTRINKDVYFYPNSLTVDAPTINIEYTNGDEEVNVYTPLYIFFPSSISMSGGSVAITAATKTTLALAGYTISEQNWPATFGTSATANMLLIPTLYDSKTIALTVTLTCVASSATVQASDNIQLYITSTPDGSHFTALAGSTTTIPATVSQWTNGFLTMTASARIPFTYTHGSTQYLAAQVWSDLGITFTTATFSAIVAS